MQAIRNAIESMAWESSAEPRDCVERALARAGIPYQRALETSWGRVDFLVEANVVVQIDAPRGRGSETFRQLGAILESLGCSGGLLLSARYRQAVEIEWYTRAAKALPVQILPLRAGCKAA
jgi:hypothetical protein